MTTLWLRADSVLRGGRSARTGAGATSLAALLVGFGMLFGGVMGSYGGFSGDRPWQVAFSASKVPILLLATFLLGLPSFFVLNSIAGLRSDFPEAVRALLRAQSAVTIVLASLAPLTILWYASFRDYGQAILFNGLLFGLAALGGQVVLRREYRTLIGRDRRHRSMLLAWLLVYSFTGIQMGWTLRPFLGDPNRSVQFFRPDFGGNAYVVVARLIRDQWPGSGFMDVSDRRPADPATPR